MRKGTFTDSATELSLNRNFGRSGFRGHGNFIFVPFIRSVVLSRPRKTLYPMDSQRFSPVALITLIAIAEKDIVSSMISPLLL
jgi:hypothetical protein